MKRIFAFVILGQTALSLPIFFAHAAEPVNFDRQIKPLLESHCLSCHSGEHIKGGLSLDTKAGALKGGDSKGTSLVVGKPAQSPLFATTTLAADHDDLMPPKGKGGPLPKEQTELLRRWIEEGANWPDSVTLKTVQRVDFVRDIQPILEFNCVACHREGQTKGDLRLDNKSDAFKGGKNGLAIAPNDPKGSKLFTSVTLPPEDDDLMPPTKKGGPLPKDKIELLRSWIEQGAVWPDGLNLTPKKAEELAGGNEPITVAEIHKRIVAKQTVTTEAEMKKFTDSIPGTGVKFDLLPIPSGEFLMGSPANEPGRGADEGPQHKVRIEPFWMGKCEVTWNEYQLFMFPELEKRSTANYTEEPVADAVTRPTRPYVEMSFGMGKDDYPAISMTQHAANKYCEWLSAKTGQFYRLPTEAEWEYACRAGTTTAYSWGDDPSAAGEYAWFDKNSDFKYQKVGKKKPNPWGLHDMHGNVAEWCIDQYEPSYEKFTDTVTQSPWTKATKPYPHVARGGSWWDEDPTKLRSAARLASDKSWKKQDPQLPKSIWFLTDAQFLGFRLVRPLKVPAPEELSKYWTSGVERE
ncbi:MAG: SUMF1/EgtB/PvdO family nonheme iron enzyme [Verrucomicrobia bacterium]|nr:SUMF1/EgtB/PvdO family nonheme iron enzyme [Verrucomicrobiota bacterium]